jgi:hypothetical protein
MDAAPRLGGIELSGLDFTFPVDAVIRPSRLFPVARNPSRIGGSSVDQFLDADLSKPIDEKAPDPSKGSARATFTQKRRTMRGPGRAGTQRAAEHG